MIRDPLPLTLFFFSEGVIFNYHTYCMVIS
jgi:hypothetical protein